MVRARVVNIIGCALLILSVPADAQSPRRGPCKGRKVLFEGKCRPEAEVKAIQKRRAEERRKREQAGGSEVVASRKRATTPGSAEIEWVTIPGGTFMMGSENGEWNENPVHRVTVRTFQIAKTEVTVRQYRACVQAGACTEPLPGPFCNWGEPGRDDHPVNCVDWNQAQTFARWVGGRLPTEAEWEYAARSGGKDWKYPWGNEAATCKRAVMNDGGAGCGRDSTWPVCSKPRGNTKQGLCDMAGNVWEWVQDWYHASYDGAPSDGSAWESPEGSHRVVRGGSWNFDARNVRAARRGGVDPGYRFFDLGFRPSRSGP